MDFYTLCKRLSLYLFCDFKLEICFFLIVVNTSVLFRSDPFEDELSSSFTPSLLTSLPEDDVITIDGVNGRFVSV